MADSAVNASDAWTGGPIGESVVCVLAGNPNSMTLDGTNTWVVAPPGSDTAIVVDPGPDDASHLEAVIAAARERESPEGRNSAADPLAVFTALRAWKDVF